MIIYEVVVDGYSRYIDSRYSIKEDAELRAKEIWNKKLDIFINYENQIAIREIDVK